MNNVTFDTLQYFIFGDCLRYDPYWFGEAAQDNGPSISEVIVQVIRQWSEALASCEEGTLYLPYSLDDEWTDCFAARVEGESVTLRCVIVAVNGYDVDPLNLASFITSQPPVERECPEVFGTYQKADLVAALANATPARVPRAGVGGTVPCDGRIGK